MGIRLLNVYTYDFTILKVKYIKLNRSKNIIWTIASNFSNENIHPILLVLSIDRLLENILKESSKFYNSCFAEVLFDWYVWKPNYWILFTLLSFFTTLLGADTSVSCIWQSLDSICFQFLFILHEGTTLLLVLIEW